MSKRSDELDRVRRDFVGQVDAALSTEGWAHRPMGRADGATFTRPLANGVIAVAEVDRFPEWSIPARWPVTMVVRIGAGYEPLLGLLPRLAAPPRALLSELTITPSDPDFDSFNGFKVDIAHAADVPRVVRTVVDAVLRLAAPFAEGFDGADTFLALGTPEKLVRVRSDPGRDKSEAAWRDLSEAEVLPLSSRTLLGRRNTSPLRVALLALSGGLGQAYSLLEQIEVERAWPDARFTRQLSRWMDAGAPAVPPLEETMDLLSRTARVYKTLKDRTAQSAESALLREATDEVSAVAAGRTDEAVAGLLRQALDAREVRMPQTQVAMLVVQMRERRSSLGSVRQLISKTRLVNDGLRVLAAPWWGLLGGGELKPAPNWLEPPEADGFRVAYGDAWLVPQLTRDAPILERALAAGLIQIGPLRLCQVWLTRGPDGTAVVQLGQEVVGSIDAVENERLAEVWRAADLFDERPVFTAMLSRLGPAGTPMLELALP